MSELLPLPEPEFTAFKEFGFDEPLFTTAEMHAYARANIAAERARADALKTVMIAAAEEIAAHWEAHCDAEGYGPQNLLHRLEEGIPSEYGYTAGAFADLKSRADALEAALQELLQARDAWSGFSDGTIEYIRERDRWYSAINAARSLLEKTNDRKE